MNLFFNLDFMKIITKAFLKSLQKRFTSCRKWIPDLKEEWVIKADIIAWITGAIIVLPQWIAFATIAWLPAEYWLYTAMVTPIIAAIFGSSRHLISWPTTAISLVIFSTLKWFTEIWSPEFIQLALVLTFLAWVYQLVFWLVKLGKVVDFVSHTVVIGFTAWAAILIVTSQMKSIFWLSIPRWTEFLETWKIISENITESNIYAIIVWVSTLLIAVLVKKYFKKIPNLLVALILGSLIAYFFKEHFSGKDFVEAIPSKLPSFSVPSLSMGNIRTLASWAFAIAILWLIEAVSIGRAVASKSHQMIDANQEFVWQWMSNIVWSFFSAYAWSGSFTRSWVNYSAWAKTPMSGIFAAVFLMLIILLIAPITKYISVPAMAWVIVLVGYNLVDFWQIKHVLKVSKSETSILLVTFFCTLFLELEFAIYFWILLSLIIFLNRTSTPRIVRLYSIFDEKKNKKTLTSEHRLSCSDIEGLKCPQIWIIRVDMSIYFWSSNYINDFLNKMSSKEWINSIIMLCTSINMIDMTWMEMLEKVNTILKKKWWWLYFLELKTPVMEKLKKSGFVKHIWEDHFFDVKKEAIFTVVSKVNKEKCKKCKNKVFEQCSKK